jgi:hypothetical protein
MRPFMPMIAAAALWGGAISAQETTGDLRGRVVAGADSGLAGAEIQATGDNLQGSRTTVSKVDGVFVLLSLPPGVYTLRIRAIGHRPIVVDSAMVRLGRTTGLGDLSLVPAPLELSEIMVTAPRVSLDPVRTTIGATLQASDYDNLPAERDYKSLIVILPHINTSFHGDPVNAAGSTGLENMYFIDGVNVTSTRRASTGTSLPYNFVRAVEVKAGGYEAQYGRGLGAVVNAVTYSGTNDPEVNMFGFVTHSAFAAGPKAEPSLREGNSVHYDIGARVSGPIVRDRLWYSAAYNPRIDRVEKDIPGHGGFTDRRTAHVFAGKLTWSASTRANLELSMFGDPTVQHEVEVPFATPTAATVLNPDPYLTKREAGGVTGTLRASMAVGRIDLLATLSHARNQGSWLPETEAGGIESRYVDFVTSAIGGGIFLEEQVREARTAASLGGNVGLGRHTLAFGAEYEDGELSLVQHRPGLGGIGRQDTSRYVLVSESSEGTYHNFVPTAYLQDAWRVADRFTLNAGLRWSSQRFTGASGATAQRFSDEWQPRLGFSWQLGSSEAQRLFGSYGRFYQQEPLNLPSAWFVDYTFIQTVYSADPRQPGAPVIGGFDGSTYEDDWGRQENLAAEHFDEFTLGYERLLGAATQFTLRGVHRALRSSWQWGADPDNPDFWVLGTPGEGEFAFLPPPRRQYTALEVGVQGDGRRLNYRVSYVLSRAWGNYTGLYGSDAGFGNPGGNLNFFAPDQAANSTGLLPNDRTHVLKGVGVYRTGIGLSVGAFFSWQSGTPLNDFAPGVALGPTTPVFLAPRGSVGRTPAIWDLNLRLRYDTPWPSGSRGDLLLDFLHLGNPQRAVRLDEHRFLIQGAENPAYLQPVAFQPAMTARLGFEVSF